MARTTRRRATINRNGVGLMVARMVACVPMIPAIMVNVDMAATQSRAWLLAAISFVVFAALFAETAMIQAGRRRYLLALVLGMTSAVFLVINVLNATMNATFRSDDRRDHRKNAIIAAEKRSSQSSQWSHGRAEQAKVAGETAVEAIEADIQHRIAADAKRWAATEECNPLKTTAKASATLCKDVAELKAKLAAARKRDELDAKLAALDAATAESAEPPTVADPVVENMVSLFGFFGSTVSDEQRRLLGAIPDWTKAVGLELLAALGPMVIMLLFEHMTRGREQEPTTEPKPAAATKPVPETTKPEPKDDPAIASESPLHGFVATKLDRHEGAVMSAKDVFRLWQFYCAEKGMDPGSQKRFGTDLQRIIPRENANNRPRYLNVRPKTGAPALRLVAGAA